jgi:hypothetical protein
MHITTILNSLRKKRKDRKKYGIMFFILLSLFFLLWDIVLQKTK